MNNAYTLLCSLSHQFLFQNRTLKRMLGVFVSVLHVTSHFDVSLLRVCAFYCVCNEHMHFLLNLFERQTAKTVETRRLPFQ